MTRLAPHFAHRCNRVTLTACMATAITISICVASCASLSSSSESDPGTWRTETPMLHARAAHAVVSTGTEIYALGGTGREYAPVLPVERFDGKVWTIETTLPGSGLNAPAAAALGGKIYVIGGFNTTTNIPSDAVHVYDIASRTWSTAAPLPSPRGGHAAIVMDGRIHVLGGGNSQSTLADHDVYDPTVNRWTMLAPLPRSEGSPAVVVFMGKLYAIGGRSGHSDFGAVDIYDPATDKWSAGPAIPPRGTAGAVVYCNAIHLIGGESQARVATLADVLRLDARTHTWLAQTPMPTARNFARTMLLHDTVYVVGGNLKVGPSHASEGSTVVESYRMSCG
jgi:N-acetylneuraminic acid mutarotase